MAHTREAAEELGWTELPCQIMEIDDFEAMRQTLKRNQHGSHNPLREGEMFTRMMAERNLSQRELAKEINISEATVRTALLYPKALQLRISYAGDESQARDEIETLTTRQIRAYIKLPPVVRDRWCDSGAQLADIAYCDEETFEAIESYGLAETICTEKDAFFRSLMNLKKICRWASGLPANCGIDGYLLPVAEHRLPVECLDLLPYEIENSAVEFSLSPQAWSDSVRTAVARSKTASRAYTQVRIEVEERLRTAGIDPESLSKIDFAKIWSQIRENDELTFLVEAEHMTIDERVRMYIAKLRVSRQAKCNAMISTCDYFLARRTNQTDATALKNLGDSVPYVLRFFASCAKSQVGSRPIMKCDETQLCWPLK